MRLFHVMLGMVGAFMVLAVAASAPVSAQDDQDDAVGDRDDSPGLQLGGRRPALGLPLVEREPDTRAVPREWLGSPAFRSYGAYYPYYIAPWGWYAPQTIKYKRYPPPVALEPRLGLQYNYPYAWQAGIQLPVDRDPLPPPYESGLYASEFAGVVATAKRRMEEVARRRRDEKGILLMKQGRFKAAGRQFAESFRDEGHPRYAFTLAEVFVGLGKYAHAELLLREGLKMDGGAGALPASIRDHFPTTGEFEEHVVAVDGTQHPLLKGYLLVHSKNPVAGLDALKDAVTEDEEAVLVYRHYLERAFAEEKKESTAEE